MHIQKREEGVLRGKGPGEHTGKKDKVKGREEEGRRGKGENNGKERSEKEIRRKKHQE